MIYIKEIKKTALGKLKNRWGSAIGACLVVFAISVACSIFLEILDKLNTPDFLYLVFTLLSYVVSILLSFGSICFFINYTRGNDFRISDIFHGFHTSTLKTLGTSIMTAIFVLLWTLTTLIPGILIAVFLFHNPNLYYFEPSVPIIILATIFVLALCIPGIIASIRYYFALYILKDNPEVGVFEAIRQSKELIDGYKMKFFLFQLSFIGWAILAIIPLGLGLIWLIPYVSTATTVFYNKLLEIKNFSVSSNDFTI